jgi:stress response protein YsnF
MHDYHRRPAGHGRPDRRRRERREARLEREPVTDANRGAAVSGRDISGDEHEVTLRAERPVVNRETVPVERVRLGTETVTEDHEAVRKKQIDDSDVNTTGSIR